MSADGAYFGSVFADIFMTAVSADPNNIFGIGEYGIFFHGGKQSFISCFVVLFDGGNAFKEISHIVKALFFGFFGHAGIHIGPFTVFTFGGGFEVFSGGADAF